MKKFINAFFSTTDLMHLVKPGGLAAWIHDNKHLHFLLTAAICAPVTYFFIDWQDWYNLFWFDYVCTVFAVSFIFGWLPNAAREEYWDVKTFKEQRYHTFDWSDIRWGFYGGVLGSFISLLLTLKFGK